LLRLLSSSSPALPPGKKGHGLNTNKCPCPTFPQPQGMPLLPVPVECGIGTGNLTWQLCTPSWCLAVLHTCRDRRDCGLLPGTGSPST
jgi:hypothetical protein